MSIRSGFSNFKFPINLVATPADAVSSFPIPVYKGTYIIIVNLSVVCNAVPDGVLVSLQTANTVPPAPVNEVIVRNAATAANACVARPSGATVTQSINLQTTYTFPADTTCYLRVSGNLGPGETFAMTSSVALNTVTFVQIA